MLRKKVTIYYVEEKSEREKEVGRKERRHSLMIVKESTIKQQEK